MFLKASAIAAGCLVALMSFDDAGPVPASPSLLKHPSLSLRSRAAADPAGIVAPGAVAGAIGVPGADVAGSGQRLGPVGNCGQNGKSRAMGFSLSGHGGGGDSLARHRVADPLCFRAESQRIF
jgi:hypothetical protein